MGKSKLKDTMDALDYVACYAFGRFDKLKQKIEIPPEVYAELLEAVRDTRGLMPRTCYIRDDNKNERLIFELWERVKHGSMNMKEVYAYIERQTDIPASTVEKYIARFRRGYNPTQPRYEDMLKAS